MAYYLFAADPAALPEAQQGLLVEGYHQPDLLTQQSGVWIHAAGSMLTPAGTALPLKEQHQWVWFCVDTGKVEVSWDNDAILLRSGEACVIPAGQAGAQISCSKEARCLWVAFDGALAPQFLRQMGALLHVLLRQGALPSQMYLARQIVQVIVRHNGTSDASYQLQQLMWGMLASHSGQPVCMDAMLSHEIAKVVDALRASQYKANFSLADMANISRMPMETFRKRFVSEVGMPPLGYLLYCKMEKAKELLQAHYSVKEAGAAVGMQDPYHFSKQFKSIVGMSPSAYAKQARRNEGR
ncbi:MAG: helix-turn-helix transcriptional regulator [Clostridia bacterium]|nr:helix-turn-helix transcriptional regulator [Clostridia bacterium]